MRGRGTVAESLAGRSTARASKRALGCSVGRVSTRFGEGGGQLDRRRAKGVLDPCARESEARAGNILREKLISLERDLVGFVAENAGRG